MLKCVVLLLTDLLCCAQSRLTLCDPMNCSPPGSSVHGIFLSKNTRVVPFPPPGDRPDPEIEPRSPSLQVDSLPLSHQGSPFKCINTNIYMFLYLDYIWGILKKNKQTMNSGWFWEKKLGDLVKGGYFLFTYTL